MPEKLADTVASIAQQIIDLGILAKKSYDDCRHIAAAIANLEGRKPIEISSPSVLRGVNSNIH